MSWHGVNTDVYIEACNQFGKPNMKLSSKKDWRFGSNGSVSVEKDTGRYFDHERGEGGHLVYGSGRRCVPARNISRDRANEDKDRVTAALKLLSAAQSVNNTLAERYLRTRGVTAKLSADLRYHEDCPRRNGRAPAMLALIRNVHSNEPQGVHRTFLKPDGSGRDGEKMMLGVARCGAVKLSPDAEVTSGLGIAEGIETGLSVLSAGWSPVWAVLSAGGIRRFPVLSGVETLTVFADADDAGLNAASECARRWSDAGREVRVVVPHQGDWNDV